MSTPSIIAITPKHFKRAAETLAEAFVGDPLFVYITRGLEYRRHVLTAFFTPWLRWGYYYGKAWATPGLESVFLCMTTRRHEFTQWRLKRTGMWRSRDLLGVANFDRFMESNHLTGDAHARIMGAVPHWYFWMLGTRPEMQRRGFGSALMRHAIQQAEADGAPIILETSTMDDVRFHERFGFRLVETVTIPDADLPLYFMKRP